MLSEVNINPPHLVFLVSGDCHCRNSVSTHAQDLELPRSVFDTPKIEVIMRRITRRWLVRQLAKSYPVDTVKNISIYFDIKYF